MRWVFKVIDGPEAGRAFEWAGERIVLVGRALHAHFRFRGDDPYMSELHCMLELGPGRCLLRDLDSTNGTLVNGKKVARAELQGGDEIQLGKTTIKVQAIG